METHAAITLDADDNERQQRTLDIHATITAVALAQAVATRHGLSTAAGVHRLTHAELVAVADYYGAAIQTSTVEATGHTFCHATINVNGVEVSVYGAAS